MYILRIGSQRYHSGWEQIPLHPDVLDSEEYWEENDIWSGYLEEGYAEWDEYPTYSELMYALRQEIPEGSHHFPLCGYFDVESLVENKYVFYTNIWGEEICLWLVALHCIGELSIDYKEG